MSDTLSDLIVERRSMQPAWQEPRGFDLDTDIDRVYVMGGVETGAIEGFRDNTMAIANDLFELRHPDQKDNDELRQSFIEDIVSKGERFGQWFLFPWNGELVQYPDQEDHLALRTFRNRELITTEEQKELSEASVVIFGLSVGSNVAREMLHAGIGSEWIIGDPDRISPSNLNRIKAGYRDVGSRKLDVVAKWISEVDPYVNQVHLQGGLDDESFGVLAQRKPDIIVDEVDDLGIKAKLRNFGREQGIPVVMATDVGDRSVLDVERYDSEQDTEPFNGRLNEDEVAMLTDPNLNPGDKQKLMVKLVGMENISPRLLNSVANVGKTLAGLPQLGSTAAVGGALATVASREILLGHELPSGRYTFSMENTLRLSD